MACITPYYVDNPKFGLTAKDYTKLPVPCGKCPPCIERRTNQWILRLKEEMKVIPNAYFVTLTYDTESVPITQNGFMTLEKTDLQKYFKRLRKMDKATIKYYAVGEYGSQRKRPHYHIILLGASPLYIVKAWFLDGKSLGKVHMGTVTSNSIAYTCKYIAKESLLTKKSRHARDDRQIEFSIMSKKLGLRYIEKRTSWHKDDLTRNYALIEGGIKVPLPRYYREKIYSEQERETQNIIAAALSDEKIKKQWEHYKTNNPTHTYEQFERAQEQALDQKLRVYNKNAERNRGY